MLNYRNTRFPFLVILIALFISGTATLSQYLFIIVVYAALLATGSAKIQMNFYLKAFNRGDKAYKKVAITFDDGPDKSTTPAILDILKRHNIKAAFFITGKNVEGNEQLLKRMVDEGHLIGNHSWSHSFWFDFYLPSRMVAEIKKTDNVIENATGLKINYFRPPYGVTNPFLAKALKNTGHTVVGWSLRTFDTVKNREQVLKKLKTKLSNGDIILFHDTVPQAAVLIEDAITKIRNRGFEIIRPDYLINDKFNE